MKIGIIGIGAMGSLLATRLAPFASIQMVGHWPEQLTAIQRDGLILRAPDGQETTHSVVATNEIDQIEPVDFLFILVKSHQTAVAVSQAKQILTPDGLAITLQNGLGNLEQLQTAVGTERATLGVTTQGAMIVKPGTVQDTGHGITYLATAAKTKKQIDQLATRLTQANFNIKIVPNTDSIVWGKLVVNAGINPLTAILKQPNGFLIDNPDAYAIMSAAALEVATISNALSISLPYSDPVTQTAEVARRTHSNHSSMFQDLSRGAKTEIDAICGAVIKKGANLSIPTPINQLLYQLVKKAETNQPITLPPFEESALSLPIYSQFSQLLSLSGVITA